MAVLISSLVQIKVYFWSASLDCPISQFFVCFVVKHLRHKIEFLSDEIERNYIHQLQIDI